MTLKLNGQASDRQDKEPIPHEVTKLIMPREFKNPEVLQTEADISICPISHLKHQLLLKQRVIMTAHLD